MCLHVTSRQVERNGPSDLVAVGQVAEVSHGVEHDDDHPEARVEHAQGPVELRRVLHAVLQRQHLVVIRLIPYVSFRIIPCVCRSRLLYLLKKMLRSIEKQKQI